MLGTDPRRGGPRVARSDRDRAAVVRDRRASSTSARRSSCTGRATGVAATSPTCSSWSAWRRRPAQRIGTLSGGQRRRIDLALGIVGRPELLFLDEPTTGFDPAARRRSWELIADLCGEGTTVLLTTHYLDEAEHLADRVGVLKAGRLIAEGTPAELIRTETETRVSFDLPDGIEVDELGDAVPSVRLGRRPNGSSSRRGRRRLPSPRSPVGRWLAGSSWTELSVTRPTLEDVFLDLVADDPPKMSRPTERTDERVAEQHRAGGAPDQVPDPDVLARPDRPVLHAALAAHHAGAVQRTVRRRRGHGRRQDVADPPVLHGRPGGVHRGVGDVHQPGEHGADPARGRCAETMAGHPVADVDLPRRG